MTRPLICRELRGRSVEHPDGLVRMQPRPSPPAASGSRCNRPPWIICRWSRQNIRAADTPHTEELAALEGGRPIFDENELFSESSATKRCTGSSCRHGKGAAEI